MIISSDERLNKTQNTTNMIFQIRKHFFDLNQLDGFFFFFCTTIESFEIDLKC